MSERKTAYVADDLDYVLEATADIVRFHGYEVVPFTSGDSLLKHLQEHPEVCVDLVVTDYQMPGKDGIDVLNAIKSEVRGRKTPVIVYTGVDVIKGHIEAAGGIYANKSGSPSIVHALRQVSELHNSPSP